MGEHWALYLQAANRGGTGDLTSLGRYFTLVNGLRQHDKIRFHISSMGP